MAKKSKTEKKQDATPAREPVKKTTAKAAVKPKTKAPAAPKPAKATRTAKPKAASKPKSAFTPEDVGIRAYFIAEKRHRDGIPGNQADDWIEAERQLTAEAKKAKAARKPAKKS